MTAPDTVAQSIFTLDRRAPSRHDKPALRQGVWPRRLRSRMPVNATRRVANTGVEAVGRIEFAIMLYKSALRAVEVPNIVLRRIFCAPFVDLVEHTVLQLDRIDSFFTM